MGRYIFKIKLSIFSLYNWEYQLINPIDLHYLWRASIPTSLTAFSWEKPSNSSIPVGQLSSSQMDGWMCLEGGIVPEGQQGRCRWGGGTGAAQLLQGMWTPKARSPSVSSTAPAGNVKPKGQIPMASGTGVEAPARPNHLLQLPPNNSLELQGWFVHPLCCSRGFGALSEAPAEIPLSLQAHRAENTPHTTDALPLCGAQQLCLPSVIYPAKAEFSNTSHSFPHQQEPILLPDTSSTHRSVRQRLCYSSLAAGQHTILYCCFGKTTTTTKSILSVLTFLPIQIFGL